MGALVTISVYLLYCGFTIGSLYYYFKGNWKAFLYCFFPLIHFNVTSFLNVGIAWTGDLIVLTAIGVSQFLHWFNNPERPQSFRLEFSREHKVVLALTALLAWGCLVTMFRGIELVNDFGFSPIARSLKSFVKYLLYVIPFLILARKLSGKISFDDFLTPLVVSSIFPTFAVLYQVFGIDSPMSLLHNNNTFTKVAEWKQYGFGQRAVGLSNEASFFALIITFSFLATLVKVSSSKGKDLILYIVLIALQSLAIALTMSRTGMLGTALVAISFYMQKSLKKTIYFVAVSVIFVVLINQATILAGLQFSLFDRAMSSFGSGYSFSNIERFGISQALVSMMLTTDAILGYGFFNYMFYIQNHFSNIMQLFPYESIEKIPSFNLVIQLVAENGILPSLIFAAYAIYQLASTKSISISLDRENLHRRFLVSFSLGILIFSMTVNTLAFSITFVIIAAIEARSNPQGSS